VTALKRFCIRLANAYIGSPVSRGGGLAANMLIHILKSKTHRARVTGGDVNYEGSLGIPEAKSDRAGRRQRHRQVMARSPL
jgi:hypothetical protein